LTQETVTKQATAEFSIREEPKHTERKQVSVQELIDSLKSVADDIGQISELTSEEKLLVGQFFASLLKLMQPLAPAMPVSVTVLPADPGAVAQAHLDPTGHLAVMYKDGHMELKNLGEERNRDLMVAVVEDIMPKFKSLTSAQKRKIESRIKFLTTVTKELQKISDALSAVAPAREQ
jgi:hypothetical protein